MRGKRVEEKWKDERGKMKLALYSNAIHAYLSLFPGM